MNRHVSGPVDTVQENKRGLEQTKSLHFKGVGVRQKVTHT